MKTFFCLFFLFLFHTVSAQNTWEDQIRPFEDYRNCRAGFLTNRGDTVWQAVFDETDFHNIYGSWTVKKDGYYGLLNTLGEVIVDFKYDDITGFERGMIAIVKNDKMGLMNREGEILVPVIYDTILDDHHLHAYDAPDGYAVFYTSIVNGKKGVINADFEQVVPAIYDQVSHIQHWYTKDNYYDFGAFQVSLDGKMGLMTTDGEELLSPTFKNIYLFFNNPKCASSDYSLIVTNVEGKQGVLSSSFDTLVPFFNKLDFHYRNQNDSCSEANPINIYGHNENNSRVYELRSGKTSESYSRMGEFGDYSFFRDERGWGVLDEEFNEIFVGGEGVPSYVSPIVYGLRADSLVDFQSWNPFEVQQGNSEIDRQISPKDELMWYGNLLRPEDVYWFDEGTRYFREMGLVDLKTGRKIPAKYHRIYIHEHNNERYYWALDSAKMRIDIYSNKMRLKTSFDAAYNPMYNDFVYADGYFGYSQNGILILPNSEGLSAAVSISGKVILPYEYRGIDIILDVPFRLIGRSSEGISWYDTNGKPILPENQEQIGGFNDGYYSKKDGVYQIYDRNWKIIYSNVSGIGIMNALDSLGKKVPDPNNAKHNLPAQYFVQDSLLYQVLDGVVSLMDDQRIPFQSDIEIIDYGKIVRRDGKLISSQDGRYEHCERTTTGFKSTGYHHLTYFDSLGRVVNGLENLIEIKPFHQVTYVRQEHQSGVIDRQTGEWVIEPERMEKYGAAFSVAYTQAEGSVFWIPDSEKDGNWRIINGKGDTLSDLSYEYPEFYLNWKWIVVKSDEKFGILSTSGETVLPCEYDQIFLNRADYCVSKNGKWGIFNPNNRTQNEGEIQTLDLPYTSIVRKIDYRDTASVIALVDDSLAILSSKLTPLFPVTKIEDLRKGKVDLDVFLYPSTNRNTEERDIRTKDFDKKVKTELFILNSLCNAFDTVVLNTERYEYRYPQSYYSLFEQPPHFDIVHPEVKEEYSYHSGEVPFAGIRHQIDTNLQHHRKITHYDYLNYALINGVLTPIEIREVFENPKDYDAQIGEILLDQIQKEQAMGMVCLDIPALQAELLENAVFSNGGLNFYRSDNEYNLISIPWKNLPKLKSQFSKDNP